MYRARMWRLWHRASGRLLHCPYRNLGGAGFLRRLLPRGLKARIIVFQGRQQTYLKLMMGKRVVGQYDTIDCQWRIRRPLPLFVSEATLPRLRRERRLISPLPPAPAKGDQPPPGP